MQLFDSQFRLQQYIIRLVVRGSYFWVGGTTAAAKLEGLAAKFAEKYGTDLKDSERHYKRRKGQASTRFLATQLPDGDYLWFLVATEGVGRIHEEEMLYDTRELNERIIWNKEYILHQTKRPSTMGGGKHWSWWLLHQREREISSYLDSLAKEGDPRLKCYIAEIQARPLHSGVRSQLWKMYRRANKILLARHPEIPWPGPDMSEPLPWVSKFVAAQGTKQQLKSSPELRA